MLQQILKTNKLIWIAFALILCFAALNRHSRTKIYTYSSQLMSDKAGYYVYLPAFFLYDFNANLFPKQVDMLTGNGFSLQLVNNKVHSKYPVGTAILESPFFLLAHAYVTLSGGNADGFSKPYQDALDFSAVFYLLLGLFFLSRFLVTYYPLKTVVWALVILVLGTNLYYYTVFEGAYSHVYSFFLFSLLLFLLNTFSKEQKSWQWFSLCVVFALIVLVRQANILFILASLIMLKNPVELARNRSKKEWIIGIFIGLLILLPQLAYNIYLTGGVFFYSYQNEGFIYYLTPKIKEVLFGFENGLLSTNPILLLSILGMIPLLRANKKIGIMALLAFLGCTYLYSSWWAWNLGCAYGHRGFVDIYPILVIPICESLLWIQKRKYPFVKIAGITFCILGVLINLKYIYTYDSCWPKTINQSDFDIYWHFLTSQTK